ncbi:hypothetical protein LCGC14_1528110 [marine sediment metagenome]|uniref:Uncharacterized protein n=1 Tax=marine sediment metagenome TaxID=412755 RepID=A0A0F9LXM9_9ZZZZ
MAELEIVNGPLSVYWGPVGEGFPAADAAIAGNWLLIGTSGAHNYSEDGVSVNLEKSTEFFRALASPFPRKAFTPEADVMINFQMADITIAEMRLALNQNSVTVGGTVDSIQLDIGIDPTEIALLVRGVGKSPQFLGGNVQWDVPRVVEAGSRELSFVKGEPALVELNFQMIYDEGNPNPAGLMSAQTS